MMLTVYFADPFWVGLMEWQDGSRLWAARQVFGTEPSDAEVYAFVRSDLCVLMDRTNVSVEANRMRDRPRNPKRALRAASKALRERGASSKAQEAMRMQIEASKMDRHAISRAERDAIAERKRVIAREKARARHRGH